MHCITIDRNHVQSGVAEEDVIVDWNKRRVSLGVAIDWIHQCIKKLLVKPMQVEDINPRSVDVDSIVRIRHKLDQNGNTSIPLNLMILIQC